jgi:Lrp/AsnC family leucine-responsive transcriptional regulator
MKDSPSARSGHKLTATDIAILGLLKQNARRTISEIASIAGVSRTTVRERIALLRERNIITRFTIDIADTTPTEGTYSTAFFLVRSHRPICRVIYASVSGWPELLGAWSIAGDLDMIVLVSCTSAEELERLRNRLARHPEVKTLQTLVVLNEWKSRLPLKALTSSLAVEGGIAVVMPRSTDSLVEKD